MLPIFTVVSGYDLFEGEGAFDPNRKERSVRFRLADILDATKLDFSKPDPKLFWTLRPGEIASSYVVIRIPVERSKSPGSSLTGKDQHLRILMNPWLAKRSPGERARSLWQSYGLLWLDEIPSQPVKFHVEQNPRPEGCRAYVD